MDIKFATVSAVNPITHETSIRPLVQHESVKGVEESLEYFANATGYKVAAIKAVLLGLVQVMKDNANLGLISHMDGVMYVNMNCKGSFAAANGPWVKGTNYLELNAVELEPWKTALSALTAKNVSSTLKPIIDSELDTSTGSYESFGAGHTISIGGNYLAVDSEASDEGVEVVNNGTSAITALTLVSSDMGSVKATLPQELASGEYTLRIKTRCGLGEEAGLKIATRIINIA